MATIIILLSSILGFFGGLVGYVGFDVSFWMALSIWIAAGPASVLCILLATASAPHHADRRPVLAKVA